MRNFRVLTALALGGALVATSACTTDPATGRRDINYTAVGIGAGAVGGYLLGDLIRGKNSRPEQLIGAGIGAIAGGAVGNYLDRLEADLRRETAGTGVDVIRQGDDLILRMPSSITFPVNSSTIQPQFQGTLDSVARTLANYQSTFVDVMGHASSDGADDYNMRLSQARAQSVADYLSARGVNRARLGVMGYGETQPIADNPTEAGRVANRRVEIKVRAVPQ